MVGTWHKEAPPLGSPARKPNNSPPPPRRAVPRIRPKVSQKLRDKSQYLTGSLRAKKLISGIRDHRPSHKTSKNVCRPSEFSTPFNPRTSLSTLWPRSWFVVRFLVQVNPQMIIAKFVHKPFWPPGFFSDQTFILTDLFRTHSCKFIAGASYLGLKVQGYLGGYLLGTSLPS